MTRSEALVAVVVAFAVGLLGALSLRPASGLRKAGSRPVEGIHREASGTDVLRWRVTSAFGTHLPALGENAVEVADRLRGASDGRIDWTVDDPGEVVPAFAIVDAVRAGKIEAGYTWLGYDQGKLPASVLFGSVPFGMTPWEYSAWWTQGGGRELARDLYRPLGIEPIHCGLIGPETAGWFRRSIDRVEDLQGLKIRFAGLGGRVLQRLGASVTMMPGGEIFQALEKGAIDATEFSLPAVDARLGLDRVAPYNYFPGWHQPFTAFHLVVHRPTWEALSGSTRKLIEMACDAGVHRNLARAEAGQGPALADFEARGVETRTLSSELLAALEDAAATVLAEQAERDTDFARILARQRAFRAEYARWRELAYPARAARPARAASRPESGHGR
ncbi:MAG TPA: TRAP transporter substrate-binding protein [Myxococcota bacterium]|nr:TRAP transporter substrate-binding protein [Myxococcota bacterium]